MPLTALLVALLPLAMPPQTIHDFGANDDSRWYTTHDTVMGGVSDGRVARTENNTLLFQGNLSLENNGGFTSFRSANRGLALPSSDGIEIKVLGDGRTYICSFEREGVNLFGGGYWQEFETREGAWTIIRLPWDKFEPYSFGNKMKDKPALSADTAQRIGIFLYDKKAGPFRVEFDSFSVYSNPQGVDQGISQENGNQPKAPSQGLNSYLEQVVREVVAEFNHRGITASAYRYCRSAAWTLRKAIDSLRSS